VTLLSRRAIAPGLILVFLLAACTAADPTGSATASPSEQPSESVAASEQPSSSALPSADASGEPTDELGDFACSFPVTGVGSVVRAQISDIRVGEHDGFDRAVFEFQNGIPQFTLDEATPPLLADGSGLPLDVHGNAFWQLVMQGGTRVSPDGVETFLGPSDFTPGFTRLTQLTQGGDFEAVSTWYFGLEATSCVRVLTLNDPPRLVIDVEH
jgi:hypothetical protein